jgi:hypothetical protein
MMWRVLGAGIVAGAAALATAGFAQEISENRVDAQRDWSVFVDSNPTECWSVSAPTKTVNTRDGRVVAVKRSDILLYVFYRPEANVAGQVAFTGGYPFAPGSTVSLDVGGTKFDMFTDGEWAWPATPGDDVKFINAMKRGANAVVVGRSSRGTRTEDTFSLIGFTAALDEAEKRCSS